MKTYGEPWRSFISPTGGTIVAGPVSEHGPTPAYVLGAITTGPALSDRPDLIRRAACCVNFLAGVPDNILGLTAPPDHVQLALAVLRSPDDLAPLAALVDACLEKLGGGRPQPRCDYCDRAVPLIRGRCEECILLHMAPHMKPKCPHCGMQGLTFKANICCTARLEATHPREMP